MHRSTVTRLALAVFGLTLVAFVLRGFGQLVVGPRVATTLAGPVALLAAGLLLAVLLVGALARAGVVSLEAGSDTSERDERP